RRLPEARGGGFHEALVFEPFGPRTLERDVTADAGQLVADAVDRLEVVLVRAHDACAAVVDDVGEIVRGKAEVDRHEDGPDLRDRIERLELRMRIRRDVDDAVALLDTERLQRGRPAIAALEEVAVREALVAVDDSLARRIQAT